MLHHITQRYQLQIHRNSWEILPLTTIMYSQMIVITTTDCDNMENYIVATNKASLDRVKAVTWSRVKEATISDPYLKDLRVLILTKFPASSSDLSAQLQPY